MSGIDARSGLERWKSEVICDWQFWSAKKKRLTSSSKLITPVYTLQTIAYNIPCPRIKLNHPFSISVLDYSKLECLILT